MFVIVLATGGLPAAAQSTNMNNAAPVEVTPYASLAAGAGLEEYATALNLPDGTLAAQPRQAFAINAGGGLKVPVDDHWAADDHHRRKFVCVVSLVV